MTGRAAQTTSPQDFEPDRPLGSFVSVTRGALVSPARFFAEVRREGPLRGPVLYAVACAVLSVLLGGAYDLSLAAARGELDGLSGFGVPGVGGALLAFLALLVFAPLVALLGLYVGAAVYQVLVRLFVGRENAGYYATFRVSAYLSAVALLSWVPLVGLLAGVWGVWVNASGVKELHRTTTTRALLVAVVPYAVSIAILVGQVASGESSVTEVLLRGGLTGGAGGGTP